jgi:hypothetical protein
LSYYSAFPATTPKHVKPPAIKPGTSPRGTPHATHPSAPVVPQGAHGNPSGGIGKLMNPPKTRGGTPNPITTPITHVVNPVGSPLQTLPGTVPPGMARIPGFPPGDGRDRGLVPHPMNFPSETNRFIDQKAQRGRGNNAERFRDRVGFRSDLDDNNCNRGVHHGSSFEFRLCDQDRRFLGFGSGDRIEDAIEAARRNSGFFGNIFDFDRGQFFPPQNFFNSVPIVPFFPQQQQQPFPFPPPSASPFPTPYSSSYPPIQSPYINPASYQGPPPMPIDMGNGMMMMPDPNASGMTSMDSGSGSSSGSGGLSGIADTLKQNGISGTMVVVGIGLVVLLLVMKK